MIPSRACSLAWLCAVSLALALLPGARSAAQVEADPDVELARRYFDEGTEFYQQGRYPEAIARFEAAQRRHAAAEFDYNLARCHERMDRPDLAVAAYERYLVVRPDSAQRSEIRARIDVLRARALDDRARRHRWLAPGLTAGAAIALAIAGGTTWGLTHARLDEVGTRWSLAPSEALRAEALALKPAAIAGYALVGVGVAAAAIDVVLWALAARRRGAPPSRMVATW